MGNILEKASEIDAVVPRSSFYTGNRNIPYIRWQDLVSALNDGVGDRWQAEVLDWTSRDGLALVHVRLSVVNDEGEPTMRADIGTAPLDGTPNPYETAQRKAMKRAAALFGIGLELDYNDEKVPSGNYYNTPRAPQANGQQRHAPQHRDTTVRDAVRNAPTAAQAAAAVGDGPRPQPSQYDVEGKPRYDNCTDCGVAKKTDRERQFARCFTCNDNRKKQQQAAQAPAPTNAPAPTPEPPPPPMPDVEEMPDDTEGMPW